MVRHSQLASHQASMVRHSQPDSHQASMVRHSQPDSHQASMVSHSQPASHQARMVRHSQPDSHQASMVRHSQPASENLRRPASCMSPCLQLCPGSCTAPPSPGPFNLLSKTNPGRPVSCHIQISYIPISHTRQATATAVALPPPQPSILSPHAASPRSSWPSCHCSVAPVLMAILPLQRADPNPKTLISLIK